MDQIIETQQTHMRSFTCDEFEQYTPQGPPVHRQSMRQAGSLSSQFGSHVHHCAAAILQWRGRRARSTVFDCGGETKVTQAYVTFAV